MVALVQPNQPLWTADDIRSGMCPSLPVHVGTRTASTLWQYTTPHARRTRRSPPTNATVDWFLERVPRAFYAAVARPMLLSLPGCFGRVPDQGFNV